MTVEKRDISELVQTTKARQLAGLDAWTRFRVLTSVEKRVQERSLPPVLIVTTLGSRQALVKTTNLTLMDQQARS